MRLRIGSRASALALRQTGSIAATLKAAHPGLEIDIVPVRTTGDRDQKAPLADVGGKGVFVREIEQALVAKEIDLAVHSLKDLPQMLPDGLVLGPFPKREDPRDAFVSRFGEQLRELPRGSTVGTGSPRRAAQVMRLFPNRYRIVGIRGNVETRLRKVEEGGVDATLLALAGLNRLGLAEEATEILEPGTMLPAPCQGCLGLEYREDESAVAGLLTALADARSEAEARAERALLQGIGGSCFVPLAALARVEGDEIEMRAAIASLDGKRWVEATQKAPLDQPEWLGNHLAEKILREGGSDILFAMPEPRPEA